MSIHGIDCNSDLCNVAFFEHQQQSQAICDRLFPSEESGLDTAVLTLSRELIDDFPVSDPRWAESIPAGQQIVRLRMRHMF